MNVPAVNGITYVPNDFREAGDDDNTVLEKFFAFAGSSEGRYHQVAAIGSFDLTRPLEIRGVKRYLPCFLVLNDTVGLTDAVLIKDNQGAVWTGIIHVKGLRWDTAAISLSRDTTNAVRLESNRAATLCDFNVRGVSGWGVYHAHSDSNNSNMFKIGRVTALNCGTNARRDREIFINAESFSNKESNNVHQRTTIQVSADTPLPSKDHHLTRGFVYTTDESGFKQVHLITDVDHTTQQLTVYPRIPDKWQIAGQQLGLAFGGALCLNVSGDSAKAEFGLVTATRCGPALWLSEQNTPTGVGVVSQNCATTVVLGDQPQNVFTGTKLDCLYAEGEPLGDMIITCQSGNSSGTNASTILATNGFDIDKVQTLNWLRPNGNTGKRDKYIPLIYPQGDKLFTPPYNRDIIHSAQDDEGSYTVYSSPVANVATYAYVVRKDSQIYLNDNKSTREMRGIAPTHFTLYGDGDNGQYRKNFGIKCASGYTINGQPGPISLPRYDVPITIHCQLAQDSNWIVTVTKHELI